MRWLPSGFFTSMGREQKGLLLGVTSCALIFLSMIFLRAARCSALSGRTRTRGGGTVPTP